MAYTQANTYTYANTNTLVTSSWNLQDALATIL